MKKLIFVFLLIQLFVFNCKSQITNYFDPSVFEAKRYSQWLEKSGKGVGSNYDLKYHRLDLYVDPDTCYISGSVTSYFLPLVDNLTVMEFALSDSLDVDSVIYNGNTTMFTHSSGILSIQLPYSLSLGVLDSVTVFYQGVPSSGGGFGSFVKTEHSGVPIIWTLSEPYGAMDWWPCKNMLNDKIDSLDMIITTPELYKVVSNGVLVRVDTIGIGLKYFWKHRYPIAAYLVAFAVTNYEIYTEMVPLGSDTLEMINYVYPESLSDAQAYIPFQIGVLQLFDSLFGEYPFVREKYGHAQFEWGGGMEHQTVSFVVNFGYELLAHEMSHQWFGDKITCGSWKDLWVNEGFATYSTGIMEEFLYTEANWKTYLNNLKNSIITSSDGSVYCYDTTNVGNLFSWRLRYAKGAMVLHTLRWVIGDDDFFEAIKNIISDSLLAYSYALTGDVKCHFENASGNDLTDFFNDWIYAEGYPEYTVICTLSPDTSVRVEIQQTPSDPSVSYFELPVPIQFFGGGRDTLIIFDNTYSGQMVTINPGFWIDSVKFDPELRILAVIDTMILILQIPEISKEELSIYPNPVNDHLYIYNPEQSELEIMIYDFSGKITAFYLSSEYEVDISTRSLLKGMYILKIKSERNNFQYKFVKY